MTKDITQQLDSSRPLLIFGGPYSNLHATSALRQHIESLGITPTHCICTGDIVAYCGLPTQTIALIRNWGVTVLMGNCEESLADNADDCGCGFTGGSQCDLLSVQWYRYAKQQLAEDQRLWCEQLPRKIVFRFNSINCEVVHGGVTSINRFIFASDEESVFSEEFAQTNADIIFSGHCGIPFTHQVGKKLWHNAGVIGLPANDGSTQTWYSLVYPLSPGRVRIEHHRLTYDFNAARDAMIAAKLDNGYVDSLSSGLWPSMDILPLAEQQKRGIPIATRQIEWGINC